MGPIALSLDVTDALPAEVTKGERLAISAWLFVPDDLTSLGERTTTITLLAGGSYDKRYHHAVIPGHSGYSAAEHLAGLGNIVLLADHLGVGDSSRAPVQKEATPQVCALAMHTAVTQFPCAPCRRHHQPGPAGACQRRENRRRSFDGCHADCRPAGRPPHL